MRVLNIQLKFASLVFSFGHPWFMYLSLDIKTLAGHNTKQTLITV